MKPCLLYFDTGKSSFVLKDLEILREHFRVKDYTLKLSQKWRVPIEFSRQLFITLFHSWNCEAVVVQFAGFQSYIPFIVFGWFGKKRIIVAGGTDCVGFPSIQYGNFARKYLRWFTRKSFEMADMILPVHDSLIEYDYTYQNEDYPKQGYRHFVKKISAVEKVIYNGYDPTIWFPRNVKRKKRSFLTVGANLDSRFGFRLKGVDLFVKLATVFPDYTFTIVGATEQLRSKVTPNVTIMSPIANADLPELYSKHEYYVQVSMSEGFPNALSEALLCGCIPIVSDVGAMPMIVRDEMCVLKRRSIDDLVELVNNLVAHPPKTDFRENVISDFSVKKRSEQLIAAISELITARR